MGDDIPVMGWWNDKSQQPPLRLLDNSEMCITSWLVLCEWKIWVQGCLLDCDEMSYPIYIYIYIYMVMDFFRKKKNAGFFKKSRCFVVHPESVQSFLGGGFLPPIWKNLRKSNSIEFPRICGVKIRTVWNPPPRIFVVVHFCWGRDFPKSPFLSTSPPIFLGNKARSSVFVILHLSNGSLRQAAVCSFPSTTQLISSNSCRLDDEWMMANGWWVYRCTLEVFCRLFPSVKTINFVRIYLQQFQGPFF